MINLDYTKIHHCVRVQCRESNLLYTHELSFIPEVEKDLVVDILRSFGSHQVVGKLTQLPQVVPSITIYQYYIHAHDFSCMHDT